VSRSSPVRRSLLSAYNGAAGGQFRINATVFARIVTESCATALRIEYRILSSCFDYDGRVALKPHGKPFPLPCNHI
jgi:hypothetical protein